MANEDLPLGVGTGVAAGPSPTPDPPPPGGGPEPPVWTPGMQWLAAGLLALLFAQLVYRGWGLSAYTRPPVLIQRGVTPLTTYDVNTAEEAELRLVPGFGGTLARRIVEHRDQHGPFRSVEDLRRVKGVGPAALEKARPFLHAGSYSDVQEPRAVRGARPEPDAGVPPGKKKPPESPLDVNTAPPAQLLRLPGIGPTLAGRIVEYRRTKRFESVDELRRVRGIGVKTLENLRPYVRVGPEK